MSDGRGGFSRSGAALSCALRLLLGALVGIGLLVGSPRADAFAVSTLDSMPVGAPFVLVTDLPSQGPGIGARSSGRHAPGGRDLPLAGEHAPVTRASDSRTRLLEVRPPVPRQAAARAIGTRAGDRLSRQP